jgi:hypothetical protein
LVDIITDQDFQPSDLHKTKWDSIDHQLGSDTGTWQDESQWVDVSDIKPDAGWEQTPVTISVPFHHHTQHPGSQKYTIPDFYHRSVVSILQEKLANPNDFQHFHLEPYELHWQHEAETETIRVSGELYNSPAFIEAHNELQKSPREAGCNLPRYIIGLMFASDET